jgi:hypothetical protein
MDPYNRYKGQLDELATIGVLRLARAARARSG